MGARRRARECALQILFGLDWTEDAPDTAIELFWKRFAGERPAAYEEVRKRCELLVRGVCAHRAAIDEALAANTHNWKLERMSVVDRNLLRLAAYELLFVEPKPPKNVVMNEAIEIAKKFGAAESSSFVNGVLHQLSQRKPSAQERPRDRGDEVLLGEDG